eukprot:4159916-Pyramimonas_sp.AAC.1
MEFAMTPMGRHRELQRSLSSSRGRRGSKGARAVQGRLRQQQREQSSMGSPPVPRRRSRGKAKERPKYIAISTMNVNRWSTGADILPQISSDIIFVQEHRLRKDNYQQAVEKLQRAGYKVYGAQGLVGPKGGVSSGVFILARGHLDTLADNCQ